VDNRLANDSPAVLLESHGGQLFPAGHRLGAGVPGGAATSFGTRCSAAPTAHGASEAQQEDALDPQQFDALSQTLAHASSRRQAIVRAGAAGLLAGLATAFGRGRSEALPAVQDETCRLDIVATVRLGPDATERMQTDVPGELRGEISFTLSPDGAIDAGRFLLDGGPEVPVVGQATGRAINLRADLQAVQEGLTLVLVGTAEQPLNLCTGAVDGYLTGPLPGDLGDWHAAATAIAGETRTTPPTPTPTPVPAAPSAQSCLPGLTRCGSTCVDLSSDLNNCGACGEICESGLVPVECRSGVCERASCPVGIEYCGATDLCRDLSSDPLHCGACGNVCAPGGSCVNGACLGSCEPGFTLCDSGCTDLSSDYFNCGRCGAVCGGGDAQYTCSGGECVLVDGGSPCPPELVLCGDGMGVCVDVGFDSANCGNCGFTCVGSERCEFGVCVPSVPIANIPLDEAPPDGISSCLPGLVYCGNGVCVDIYIDSFNCGGCGITCQFPQGCQGGECVG
jgi:hypothetical protein